MTPDPATLPPPAPPAAAGAPTTVPAGAPAGASTGTGAPAGAGPRPVSLAALHPAARADLQVSGPLRRGPAVVHLVRDPVAGRAYELGPKEHFVLSRLDGVRTLAEVGRAYAERFGTRLGDAHWSALLALLGRRHLLAGAPLPPVPPADRPRNTVLSGRVRLVADAAALVDRLHRLLRPLLHRAPLAALGTLVAAVLAVLAADAAELWHATTAACSQPGTLVAVLVVLEVSTAAHELAHGLAARRFGGTVTEFGLRWRLPLLSLYCEVEDVQFIPGRGRRMAVAAAGAAANLVFLLPFAVLWLVRPGPAVAAVLVFGVATAVGNLVPLPPLDGYKIVGHAVGAVVLAGESRRYLGLVLRRGDRSAYPPRLRRAYGAYGGFVVLAAAAGVTAFVLVGHRLLADRWGAAAGLAPAALLLVLLALWGAGLLAARRRSTEGVT